MTYVEWCQCEEIAHEQGMPMCVCPHTSEGVRLASLKCPVHNSAAHPYGATNRSCAPRSTTFGTFHLCKPCRDAGHMGVRP